MRQQLYRGILILLGVLTWFGYSDNATAALKTYRVPYTVQKYKTKQTSVADAYFIKPAKVIVLSNTYEVTLDIVTSHELGKYPVKVLLINGQYPKVTKKIVGTSYQYEIKFSVTKIAKPVIGRMQVDIDSLNYHHKYPFNIAFETQKLPKLKISQKKPKTPTKVTITASSASNWSSKQRSTSQAKQAKKNHTKATKIAQQKDNLAQKAKAKQARKTNQQLMIVSFATLSAVVGLAYARSLLK